MDNTHKIIIAVLCPLCLSIWISRSANARLSEEGYWMSINHQTGKSTAFWKLTIMNGVMYGFIISYPGMKTSDRCTKCSREAKDWYNKPIAGTAWLKLKKRRDDGTWEDGYIIDPDEGEKYRAKLWLEKGTLKVRGYFGFFFSTQTWLRADKKQAEAGKF